MKSKFEKAIQQFDAMNALDPNTIIYKDKEHPKELLYAQRMTKTLLNFRPDANETVQLAVRSQHICRWEIPRSNYPKNRIGYLKWRKELAKFHAKKSSDVLKSLNYKEDIINKVSDLLLKKGIKKNADTQLLEDVVCLVFLEYYFEDFSYKYSDQKITEILKKTWNKMSIKGQEEVLKIELSEKSKTLINKALNPIE